MSTEKRIPPIQLAPVQHFTVRLIDGHFVRVPKVENIAVTDATRPPTVLRPGTSSQGGDSARYRFWRLANGRFAVNSQTAPAQTPPSPPASAVPPAPKSEPPKTPPPNSWAYAFGTRLHPADSPPKT